MKNVLFLSVLACAGIISCNKQNNNYSLADHTAGMITDRQWSGNIYGYSKGDTLFPGDTAHYEWPKVFSRIITDSSFAVSRVNGFAVSIMGYTLNYRTTDEVAKTRRFDSVITGSLNAVLIYYYEKDSMSFENHVVSGYNSMANQYYQKNVLLHTR